MANEFRLLPVLALDIALAIVAGLAFWAGMKWRDIADAPAVLPPERNVVIHKPLPYPPMDLIDAGIMERVRD